MGGTGKTEIVIEYAYSRREKFDAIFWVSADDKDVLTEEFAHLASDLALVDKDDTGDLLAACELVKGWLSNPVKSDETVTLNKDVSWLLIFDNADKLDILDDFWPATGLGAVLLTSRDTLAKSQTYTANQGMDVPPFSTLDAAAFIRELTPATSQVEQDQYVEEVARTLGGLPLLITQMVGVMNRLRLTCKEFLRLCEENDLEHIDWTGNLKSQSAQVFKISTRIGLDGLNASTLGLLQMISLLDPDGIPDQVLEKAFLQRAVPDFPQNLTEYYAARAQLQESSLAQFKINGDLTLHRIVQDVAKANMAATRHDEIFNVTLVAVSNAWPFGELVDRFSTSRYGDCAKIFPSVLRVRKAHETMLAKNRSKDPDGAAALYNDAGWLYTHIIT
jgi:hypothetical protein